MIMGFPNFPGVPALSQTSLNSLSKISAAIGGASLFSSFSSNKVNPTWGIYIGRGNTPVSFDSFLSIDFKNEMDVANYPIEQGGFNSYNKVKVPYECVVKATAGSGYADAGRDVEWRSSFLTLVDLILVSTIMCTIVTPEATYTNANLESYNYKRELRNGASILLVEMHFVEIMPAATTVVTNTPTTVAPDPTATVPSAQSTVNLGMIQSGPTYKSAIPNIQ